MNYKEGYRLADTMRVQLCPRCENEQFSSEAKHCRICGAHLYNRCEGQPEIDFHGNHTGELEHHNNPGNARYCETCGTKTYFYEEGFLVSWEEEKAQIEREMLGLEGESEAATSNDSDDDGFDFLG